ncbi:hypothetical protein [Micromonospora sp. 067-2]|uniref:hypothetical protein n=1 Tax=Micromonospora sp. 067-2 TaxID=2789270 RepID=UPI00397E62F3
MGSWERFLLGSVVLLAGCTTGQSATPTGVAATAGAATSAAVAAGAATTAGAATGCGSRVETGPLPEWANAGFSGDAGTPHVLGARGEIVAVLFSHPLAQVRQDGSTNKILWVSRPATSPSDSTSSANLTITATLDGTDTKASREVVGGPGPSIIDMPRAGCWHLELRWAGHTDTIDLVYADRLP